MLIYLYTTYNLIFQYAVTPLISYHIYHKSADTTTNCSQHTHAHIISAVKYLSAGRLIVINGYNYHCRKAITADIDKQFTEIRRSVKLALSCVGSCSVTLDMWSDRNVRSYLGITAHFEVNGNLQSSLLCVHHFEGQWQTVEQRNIYPPFSSLSELIKMLQLHLNLESEHFN